MSVQIEGEVQQYPASVLEYVAEVTSLPAGRFLGRASGDIRAIVSAFAAPFFGLSALAPEVLARPTASVLLGGRVRTMAEERGRWLSLFARVFQPRCTLSFTVCAPGKPAGHGHVKALFIQPPQHILNRHWHEAIATTQLLPDALLISGLSSFEEIWSAAASLHLAEMAARAAVLWSCPTEAELLVVRAILKARKFEVSEPVPFCGIPDTPQARLDGAWWLRVHCADTRQIRQLAANERESFQSTFNGLHAYLDRAESPEHAADIALAYGTLAEVLVEGEPVDAIRVTPLMGIARVDGRVFQGDGTQTRVWRNEAVASDFLRLMPEDDAGRTPGGNRYQRMSWLGRALASGLSAHNAGGVSESVPVDAEKSAHTNPEPPPDGGPDRNAGQAITKPITQAVPSLAFRKRARLSRDVGITNVLAVAARLGRLGADPGECFALARNQIVAWLGHKGFAIQASGGSSVEETPQGEVSIESDHGRLWAMRFDDRSQMADGAFWRVEATLVAGEVAAIGLRVVQVRQVETAPPPKPGVPTVIASIAKAIGLHEAGFPLRADAWLASSQADIERLLDLLSSPDRSQPVILVSTSRGDGNETSVDRFASRLAGVAHVVRIGPDVAVQLIRRLGRNLATFGNAARLYRPGFSPDADPFHHPLWTFNELPLPLRILDDLAEEACIIGVQAKDLDERVPSFQEVRNLIAKARMRQAVQQTRELASSAEEERGRQEAVRKEIEALLELYVAENQELIAAERRFRAEREALELERDAAVDEVRRLKYQLSNLRQAGPVEAPAPDIEQEDRYPTTWDDLETWVECFANDRLVLLPQAAKAARASAFQDIPFAYRVLEFLVEHYVPLRMRDRDDEETRKAYEAARVALGADVSPVGDAVEDKRYKREYRRRYNGKEIKLDLHVKRGGGFDPANLFRLYFSYDSASSRVIVGHLPTHLTNRITHAG